MFSRTQLLVAHAEKMTRTAGSRIAVRAIPLIGKSPSRGFDDSNVGHYIAAHPEQEPYPRIDSMGPTGLHGSAWRNAPIHVRFAGSRHTRRVSGCVWFTRRPCKFGDGGRPRFRITAATTPVGSRPSLDHAPPSWPRRGPCPLP